MKLHQLVIKDVVRRKRRIFYSALGVVVGTMTVVAILTMAAAGEARIYNQVDKYGANLTVVPAISNVDMKIGDLSLGILAVGENYISDDKLMKVRQITESKIRESTCASAKAEDTALSPKLYINTTVRGISATVVGIEPVEESRIKTWWKVRQGEYLTDANQAVAGAIAANSLKLNVGDAITLNKTDVVIAGILDETGSNDDYQIFVPITTLQKEFGKDGLISSVDIRAPCSACPVEYIVDDINQGISGVRAVSVKQIAESETGIVKRMERFMLALAGITLAVGSFGVASTMMSSVHQRIKDIGIMRAVGASRGQIITAFIYEAFIVGVLGGIIGYLAGTLLAYAIGPVIFAGANVTFLPQYLPLSFLLAITVSTIAAVYPAYSATKIKVADSFRSL
ncbi:MAG: ABC transporter permease [Chloroflexi bacterium]|nr:ABC transporter permease [Chloroflexota bacterium]